MKQFISWLLAFVLILSAQMGMLVAYAEQTAPAPTEELPLTQTLPSGVREDGTLDGDIVKQWVDAYLTENHWDSPGCVMGIAYWYSGTGETWYYHADDWIGGVNWYKLPICMHYAEELASGEMTKESVVTGITLEYAMNTTLENSSGPSLYSLVTDLTEREGASYAEIARQYADLPDSYFTSEFYNNAYTARLMMEITKTLFQGGEERFPNVLEPMKKSQPEDLFKRDWIIRTAWDCAQTHAADWGGAGDDLIHCTGIFYTPTPVVLTIMTKNIWDLDIMGGVAGHFANLAVEMSEKQKQAEEAAEAADQSASTPTEGENGADGQTADTRLTGTGDTETAENAVEMETARISTPAPPETPAADHDAAATAPKRSFRLLIVLIIILLLLIVAEIVLTIVRRSRQHKRAYNAIAEDKKEISAVVSRRDDCADSIFLCFLSASAPGDIFFQRDTALGDLVGELLTDIAIVPRLIDDPGNVAALRRVAEDEAVVGGVFLEPLLGAGGFLPLGEVGEGLIDDIRGEAELVLTRTGIGDFFGGEFRCFFNGAVMLQHDTDDLVVKELLLEFLGSIGGTDHGKAGIVSPAVLHHLPADRGTAGVQLVFFHDGAEFRNVAFLHGGIRTHDRQQIQLQIIQARLLFCRERGEAFGGCLIPGVFIPGIGLEFLQRIQYQKTGTLLGTAV